MSRQPTAVSRPPRKPLRPLKIGELHIRCTVCHTLLLVRVGRHTDQASVIGVLRRRGWRAEILRDLACPTCAAKGKSNSPRRRGEHGG